MCVVCMDRPAVSDHSGLCNPCLAALDRAWDSSLFPVEESIKAACKRARLAERKRMRPVLEAFLNLYQRVKAHARIEGWGGADDEIAKAEEFIKERRHNREKR